MRTYNDKLVVTENLQHVLAHEMKSATEVTICVAFIKTSGLQLIERDFEAVLKRGGCLTVVAGLDFYITEPAALRILLGMFRKHHDRGTLYLMEQGNKTYHPKLYLMASSKMASLVVGSANLSAGGLDGNIEVSILHRLPLESVIINQAQVFIRKLIGSTRCTRADGIEIGLYERKYAAYHKEQKRFEKNAKMAIADIHSFSTTKMLRYLRKYETDPEHQEGWVNKQSNYREARKVLDRMLRRQFKSKADFLEEYERLVGASGGDKLWHSGSVYRSKNKVAARYKRFITMLRALKARLGASPEILFQTGQSHIKNIPGLGPNVLTEILNTYDPKRYAVLNKNPVASLKEMGLTEFPSPQIFSPDKYGEFVVLLKEVVDICGLKDLSHADHFCNYVYWDIKNHKESE